MTSEPFLEVSENIAATVQGSPDVENPQHQHFQEHSKEYVFFIQMALLFIVIIAAVINISLGNDKQEVWMILLSTGLGALLPNPKLGKCKKLKVPLTEAIHTETPTQ